MTSGPPTRVPALDRRPPDRNTDLARVRLQLDGLVERRLLRPLTPPEQAYMEALQEIEDGLLQGSLPVGQPKGEDGATPPASIRNGEAEG
jgi:hypothetical protein